MQNSLLYKGVRVKSAHAALLLVAVFGSRLSGETVEIGTIQSEVVSYITGFTDTVFSFSNRSTSALNVYLADSGYLGPVAPGQMKDLTGCGDCGTSAVFQFYGNLSSTNFSVNGRSFYASDTTWGSYLAQTGVNGTIPISIEAVSSEPRISLPTRAEILLDTVLNGLQATAQQWTRAVADWQISGVLTSLENFFTSTIETTVSNTLSRIGGVFIGTGQQILTNPDAYYPGVDAIKQISQSNDRTGNIVANRILARVECEDAPSSCGRPPVSPATPSSTEGPTERFNLSVIRDILHIFDPDLSEGYEYATGNGNPNFASAVFPYIGTNRTYRIEVLKNGEWVVLDEIAALSEYTFPEGGIDRFRVRGIEVNGSNNSQWISGLSFVDNGAFTGTITSLNVTPVPEPSTWIGAGLFLGALLGVKGRFSTPK